MSEQEKEKEKEEKEGVILDHFYHRHPLTLTVAGSRSGRCYGCRRFIYPKETAYMCEKCRASVRLHEECAEMPREITLSMHPQHPLIQTEKWYIPKCALCQERIVFIGYYCSTSDTCSFRVHVGCAQDMSVLKSTIDHPSHPHPLTTMWRPGRSCSFRCDACGTTQKGNSYICSDCQYWIHESCAALPPTKDFPHHHRHPLSLAYHVPSDYVRFDFKCHICFKDLLPKYWVYHCGICRYVAHIKCAIGNISSITSNIDVDAAEDEDVIVFPLTDDAVEDLIESFVTKVGEVQAIPNGNYKFHNHEHELHLISSTLLHNQQKVVNDEDDDEDDDDDDDDDDDLNYRKKSELVCDGCTVPINCEKQYLSCGKCKYFLHLPCSQLPPNLLSHPLHPKPDHDLILQTSPKLDLTYCNLCGFHTNGLFYKCTKSDCNFKADIKCASLPDTIKHEAHPNHHFKLLNRADTSNNNFWHRHCGACGKDTYGSVCYICHTCEIILHSSCSLLPASLNNPIWDKHTLPLTFDASVDHPSSFYCEICEEEMNPKRWMYHCSHCDVSIHPHCLTTATGEYRNIKFGQQYVIEHHGHPLAYQLLTAKLHCDVCGQRKDYGSRGFQCHSHKCDFFMCYVKCGRDEQVTMRAFD